MTMIVNKLTHNTPAHATMDKYQKLKQEGFFIIRNFLSLELCEHFEQQTRYLPRKRVFTTNPELGYYDSQIIPEESPLWQFFTHEGVTEIISQALNIMHTRPKSIQTWLHRYQPHEYIPRHKDVAGTLQLLITLQKPSMSNGGILHLEKNSSAEPLDLEIGDALFFKATEIAHYTNELIPSHSNPTPHRVIAVARYFY